MFNDRSIRWWLINQITEVFPGKSILLFFRHFLSSLETVVLQRITLFIQCWDDCSYSWTKVMEKEKQRLQSELRTAWQTRDKNRGSHSFIHSPIILSLSLLTHFHQLFSLLTPFPHNDFQQKNLHTTRHHYKRKMSVEEAEVGRQDIDNTFHDLPFFHRTSYSRLMDEGCIRIIHCIDSYLQSILCRRWELYTWL